MRRISFIKNKMAALSLALCSLFVSALLTACPSADGLHNQPALMVTMEFTGFGNTSGDYSIPGSFDGISDPWTRGMNNVDVVMKNGEGTTINPIPVTASNIQFSLVPTGEWTRPWNTELGLEGNGSDKGVMHNFYIDDLDLNAGEITLLIDASSGIATPTVK